MYIWNKHFGDTLELKFPRALTMILLSNSSCSFFPPPNLLLVTSVFNCCFSRPDHIVVEGVEWEIYEALEFPSDDLGQGLKL